MTASAHIDETTKAQRLAASPALSAFVSANAGAGKTRVLTNRVARLLLNGADPSTILCITFTKAAAAEMADRLFKLLGDWALAKDAALQEALAELDGDRRQRDADELARARRLFARALETPGGLKIQTIHSFCESVLHRFPLEAGVAPGFAVIEEIEAAELKRASIDHIAAHADAMIADTFDRLLARITGKALRELLESAIGARRKYARAFEIGWEAFGDEVAATLGVAPGQVVSAQTLVDLISAFDLDRLKDLMLDGGKTTQEAAPLIDRFRAAGDAQARFDAIRSVFLTDKGTPRSAVISKKLADADPAFAAAIRRLQTDIVDGLDLQRACEALDDTRALFRILDACFADYALRKSARAALDFDDLIEATARLLMSRGGAQWVLYKLDMGLAHILLDEAQDTGPDAWSVIEAPLDEFFAGAGVKDRIRTFFAVGDQKQSIYSFQGADAALFKEKEASIGKRIDAAHDYRNVTLSASFRTTAPVLSFVDALFSRDEIIDNVSADRPLSHLCTREGEAGLVELWPLAKRAETSRPDPWDAPLDAAPPDNPARRLANEVARLIRDWLDRGERLESQGRPITPGDIMILVQSRGALFTEMIRALGAERVPVAGADKIRLMEDQGVLDLVSYARAALFEGDDLSLAETLKSPFFGVSEDSLYDLAAERRAPRLWDALRERSAERADWNRAFGEIAAAREIALEDGAAAFFTHVLETGAPSGWRRLAGRLGYSCREPIEEFLRQAHDFEASQPRSLRLFLDAIARSGAEISREASEAGPTVRVMTAHKAKGLEAGIVFLLDAHRHPPVRNIGSLLALEGPDGDRLPVLALGDAKDSRKLATARDAAKRLMRDEYRRLLYVAATRARDRLYVCGHEQGASGDPHKPPPAEKSWHALAEDAFELLGAAIVDGGARLEGRAQRFASPQTAPIKRKETPAAQMIAAAPDACLRRLAPAEPRPRRLSPSQLVSHREGPAYSPARDERFFLRGRILHRLLELLPEVAPEGRPAAADRLLSHHVGDFSADQIAEMRDEALRVLADPRFADVFAPGNLAEAAIGGRLACAGGETLLLGQIDRLAILRDRVLVVDYKTNRPPPTRIEDTPLAYLAQMAAYRGLLRGIYPDRRIEAALLWTFDARLMALPDDALDRALSMTLA